MRKDRIIQTYLVIALAKIKKPAHTDQVGHHLRNITPTPPTKMDLTPPPPPQGVGVGVGVGELNPFLWVGLEWCFLSGGQLDLSLCGRVF